jgi:hypothetical protein
MPSQQEIKRIEDLLLKELENLACPAAEILPDAIRLTEFVHATNRLRPALIRFLDILEEETQKEIASLTEAHKVEMENAQKEIDHLSNYAQHDIQCITQFEEDEECDCGLVNIEVK